MNLHRTCQKDLKTPAHQDAQSQMNFFLMQQIISVKLAKETPVIHVP